MFVGLLLSLAGAGLSALCFPAGVMPWLFFLCIIPFIFAVQSAGAWRGVLFGFVYGFTLWFMSTWWLAVGLEWYSRLEPAQAWLWTVVASIVSAVPYVVFGFLAARTDVLHRPFGQLRAAVLFTVPVAWYPLAFPGNLAHSIYTYPYLTQIIDLAGVPLLLFTLVLINFLLFEGLRSLRSGASRTAVVNIASAVAVVVIMVGYSAYRIHDLKQERASAAEDRFITVAAVQPNIPVGREDLKIYGDSEPPTTEDALKLSKTVLEGRDDVDIVVWPELPRTFGSNPEGWMMSKILQTAREHETPFLITSMEDKEEGDGYYNTAFYINAAGEMEAKYRKIILFPFGEYLPFEDDISLMRELFPDVLKYRPGNSTRAIAFNDTIRIIPSLCYEAIFSGLVSEFMDQGGNILLNMCDDAWFGPTDATNQHLNLGVYRTVEYRIPFVRTTNSGVGAHITAWGEILPGSRTAMYEQKVSVFKVYVPQERSLYARIGDIFLYILSLIAAADVVYMSIRRRRENTLQ